MKYAQKHLALGSEIELCIVSNRPQKDIDALYQSLWQRIFSFEKQCSRFLPASELSFFNRRAGTKHTITPSFRQALVAAKTISLTTEGLYNPFILPALQAAGYSHSLVPGHENDAIDDYSHRRVVPITKLEIGDDWARIPYGTAIDLGGCGKGYVGDQLAAMIPEWVSGFWFSLGGDLVAGGTDENGESWKIGVQDAESPHKNRAFITVPPHSQLAIATSGTTHRRGVKDGKTWHHLIDPRTLRPAVTTMRVATVCAKSSLTADVLASCAVILSHNDSREFLQKNAVTTAVLQYSAGGQLQTDYFGVEVSMDEPIDELKTITV